MQASTWPGCRGLTYAVAGLLATVLLAWCAPAQAQPNQISCALHEENGSFAGPCTVPCLVNALLIDIDGPRPGAACTTPPREVEATLRPIGPGKWLGTMPGKFAEDPTRFELLDATPTGPGVAKTPFGWFALASDRRDGNTMALVIDASRQLPPTQDDIRIIDRARALLSSQNTWNKEDTRTCPPNPRHWSLFCALQQATAEVSGGVHYRQPALQAVRQLVDEVDGLNVRKHRLMEFNNSPATTLDTIHGVLQTTRSRLEARLR